MKQQIVLPTSTLYLPAFIAFAFGWSWACWLLAFALKLNSPMLGIALLLAGGFGPGLAAVALVAYCCGAMDCAAGWFCASNGA